MKEFKDLQKGLKRLGNLKLDIHRAKGSWKHVDYSTLLKELKDEIQELEREVDFEKKLLELGDIYNYLLFLYDKILDEKSLAKRLKNQERKENDSKA